MIRAITGEPERFTAMNGFISPVPDGTKFMDETVLVHEKRVPGTDPVKTAAVVC